MYYLKFKKKNKIFKKHNFTESVDLKNCIYINLKKKIMIYNFCIYQFAISQAKNQIQNFIQNYKTFCNEIFGS